MPSTIDPNGTAGVQFANAIDVDNFFQQRKRQPYIRWFNSTLANQGPWAGVRLVDNPQNDVGFHQFWNQTGHIFGGPISLVQFVSLMSILSNEVRGDFQPRTERMGIANHPGMAYLFDKIPSKKRSYNTLTGNRTALECFQHEAFIAAHGALALGSQLAATKDPRWSGETWPQDFPTDASAAKAGFITQADFMKYRGRGFIQTTGRANYTPLIGFVLTYGGENSVLDFYQHQWRGKEAEEIAFASSNEDWDTLFQKTDLIVATEAVRVHNENSGRYLQLSPDAAVLNGKGAGSAFFMGRQISGGDAYAETFTQRVAETMKALSS